MSHNKRIFDQVEVGVRTEIKTTYVYRPIIEEVLGFWRVESRNQLGSRVEVHLRHALEEYDTFFINGKEVNIPDLFERE